MATVEFVEASCPHPDRGHAAVHPLTLTVTDGEFLVLLGPTGSGKTTVLRMLSGLQPLESGAVFIDGEDVTHVSPGQRNVAMVFEHRAGYPGKAAGGGPAMAVNPDGKPESEAVRRVRQIAAELEIGDHVDHLPGVPGGGDRRPGAARRPTARQPRVHLLDEPLTMLSPAMRSSARARIASLQRRTGITTLYTTHDGAEAVALGDRVAVLNEGVLQQVGTPRALYERPANTFVAGIVGTPAMNLVPAQYSNGWVFMGSASVLELPVPPAVAAALTTRSVIVGFRPEHARLTPLGAGIYATVEAVENLGATAYVRCDIGVGREYRPLVVRCAGHEAPEVGSAVAVMPELQTLHLFDGRTGHRLQEAVAQRPPGDHGGDLREALRKQK